MHFCSVATRFDTRRMKMPSAYHSRLEITDRRWVSTSILCTWKNSDSIRHTCPYMKNRGKWHFLTQIQYPVEHRSSNNLKTDCAVQVGEGNTNCSFEWWWNAGVFAKRNEVTSLRYCPRCIRESTVPRLHSADPWRTIRRTDVFHWAATRAGPVEE